MYRSIAGTAPPRLMLTPAGVRQLADAGIDIGAHTVNHPILKGMADDDARSEIVGSARWVADVTGRAPRSFAYPNGRPGVDYDGRHAAMTREAGFELAVTTQWVMRRVHPALMSCRVSRRGTVHVIVSGRA